MQNLKTVGSVGIKALIYFEIVTTLALIIGLTVSHVVRPGDGMNIDPSQIDGGAVAEFVTKAKEQTTVQFLLDLIPNSVVGAFVDGNILQVLLFAILFAFALQARGQRGKSRSPAGDADGGEQAANGWRNKSPERRHEGLFFDRVIAPYPRPSLSCHSASISHRWGRFRRHTVGEMRGRVCAEEPTAMHMRGPCTMRSTCLGQPKQPGNAGEDRSSGSGLTSWFPELSSRRGGGKPPKKTTSAATPSPRSSLLLAHPTPLRGAGRMRVDYLLAPATPLRGAGRRRAPGSNLTRDAGRILGASSYNSSAEVTLTPTVCQGGGSRG